MICFPLPAQHTPLLILYVTSEETHSTSDMGSLTWEKHIPSDTCRQDKTRQDNALFGVLYSPMYIDFIQII